jgi:hypothetical protein
LSTQYLLGIAETPGGRVAGPPTVVGLTVPPGTTEVGGEDVDVGAVGAPGDVVGPGSSVGFGDSVGCGGGVGFGGVDGIGVRSVPFPIGPGPVPLPLPFE